MEASPPSIAFYTSLIITWSVMMGIYDYDAAIRGSLKRLSKSSVSSVNQAHVLRYFDYLRASGMSKARIDRYLQVLKLFGELVSKDFKLLCKDDVVGLVGEIESRDYSGWTKVTYKRIFKCFITWLFGGEDAPDIVRWIKFTHAGGKRLPEGLLTQDEVKSLIGACKNSRDRALVSTLYETGCRIGELGSLLIKNVSFDKFGAVLLVSGKTGQRRVRIMNSVPYLADWLNKHPCNGPDSSLWVSLPPNPCNPLDYATFRKILLVLAKRVGICKRVNPHSFRHARATHLSNHLTEAQMKEYFGWTQGSDMASVYIHLSGRDVDKALLKLNGFDFKEDKASESLNLIKCSRCEHMNAPTNKYCGKCGLVLDVKDAIELEEVSKKKDELLNLLINDPDVKRLLIEKAKVMVNG